MCVLTSVKLCHIWPIPVGANSFLVLARTQKYQKSLLSLLLPEKLGYLCLRPALVLAFAFLQPYIMLWQKLALLTWYPGLIQTWWALLTNPPWVLSQKVPSSPHWGARMGLSWQGLPSQMKQLALTVPWCFNCRLSSLMDYYNMFLFWEVEFF